MIFNFTIPDTYDDIWLIGIRIDPDREGVNFYTLMFEGDRDIPLNEDNYLILFSDLDVLYEAIERSIPSIYLKLKEAELYSIDVAGMLCLIQKEELQHDCIILDSLNILLDLLSCTTNYFPKGYKKKLFNCADHFTFSNSITDFFENNNYKRQETSNYKRQEIIDILHWAIGAVVSRSKFYTAKDLPEKH